MDFPPRGQTIHLFILLAEKNSALSKCLSPFENILEFLVSFPCFLHSYINVDLFWKSAGNTHFKVFVVLFPPFFAFHLAGQLFKLWCNQTVPIYTSDFKIDVVSHWFYIL